jgi:hypothetical protein
MNDQEQLMLEVFKDEQSRARHSETQRLEVTKFILAAAAALLGVMGVLKFSIGSIPLAIATIYLGWFGRRFTKIYVSRFDDHTRRARGLRTALDTAAGGKVQEILEENPIDQSVGSVRDFWNQLHTALMIFGALCLLWILGAWSMSHLCHCSTPFPVGLQQD